MEALKKVKFYGMEWPIFVFFAGVIIVSGYLNIIPVQLLGAVAVLATLGIIFGELGERLPIWNKYCGGGAILVFVACGFMVYMKWLPSSVMKNAKEWMNTYSFLNMFISFLIVGSLLGIDRKLLLKSSALFLPNILAGVFMSGVFGVIAGKFFGVDPLVVLTSYVLPIMGGGVGAGAVPMAKVYQDVTGLDAGSYLTFAVAILSIGNLLAVVFAVILNTLGRLVPKLSGNGNMIRAQGREMDVAETSKVNLTMDDIGAAIFLTAGFFMLATLVSKEILPKIMGVPIPSFAYLIIFATMANAFNLIPENLKAAAHKCQQFCGNKLVWIQMAGCGLIYIDFDKVTGVISFENLAIAAMIVCGACVGTMIFGWFVGFYPIESAITAGLCMANMGGAGDLAVLGAAKRMELMSYAQISSRIGGGMILLIGSIVFSMLK